jgi:thiol-disulfide isomerase/thioredoxin
MMKLFNWAITLSAFLLASAAPVASAANQTPNFSFKDVDGRSHQFSEYRGKWVIVNYWATYCGPCVAELPALNSIAKRNKGNVVVLGMEAGETPTGELKQFAAQRNLSYPIVPTQDSTMFAMGLIYGVPTTFIVNPEGKIVDTHMGAVSAVQLQNYIRSNKRSAVVKEENCMTGLC